MPRTAVEPVACRGIRFCGGIGELLLQSCQDCISPSLKSPIQREDVSDLNLKAQLMDRLANDEFLRRNHEKKRQRTQTFVVLTSDRERDDFRVKTMMMRCSGSVSEH